MSAETSFVSRGISATTIDSQYIPTTAIPAKVQARISTTPSKVANFSAPATSSLYVDFL